MDSERIPTRPPTTITKSVIGVGEWLACLPHATSAEPWRAKPLRKCVLPGCGVMTDHNGGYCCAEHCRRHRGESGLR